MNRKGFMMAEVVVVSAIVLVTLVSFYVSYNKIITLYNQRIDYYDVTTLYELASVRDNISDYSEYSSKSSIINEEYKKVYYIKNTDLNNIDVSNQTFKDYLKYIEDSVSFETDYVLVMEKCLNGDIDNCKYAYLEVFDTNGNDDDNNSGGTSANTGGNSANTGGNSSNVDSCTDVSNATCCAQVCKTSSLFGIVKNGTCYCCTSLVNDPLNLSDGQACTWLG